MTDIVNPGHPALDFGLRDYPLVVLDADQKVVALRNPSKLPDTAPEAAFLLAGARLSLVDAVAALCPGGAWSESTDPYKNVVDFRVYSFPADSCQVDLKPR